MKRLLCAVVVLLAVAVPASAQNTPRNGLWGGFGFGAGSIGCDGCVDRTTGLSGFAVIGGTLSDVVRIGGGSTFFVKEEGNATLSLGSGLFIVQLFPGAGDFYLQAGAGFGTAELEVGNTTVTDEGAAFLIGAGYNINLGQSGNIALVPFANWVPTSIGFSPELFQLGLGLVWN